MPRKPNSSRQTRALLAALLDRSPSWRHGYDLSKETGLRSGTLYPLLMFNAPPGADANLKFEQIFSKAPVWLLNFTGIEWDAKLLGFKLPKLVGAPALGGWEGGNRWGHGPAVVTGGAPPSGTSDAPTNP